ncbi:MAG: glycosyltransferase [Microthrixaceae bacterium]|nr:glycosyltransferase [Microthrixaceae bacterium]
MTNPELSIIIPVHNNAPHLAAQLDSIEAAVSKDSQTEIVVVDNRSTDGSGAIAAGWARQSRLSARIVEATLKPGEPYARNVGVEASDGGLIAFCDGDDVVDRRWVQAMTAGLAHHRYVTGPVNTSTLNEPRQQNMRGTLGRASTPTTYGNIPFASGCNMGFRREVLYELGGFDESFLIGCDIEIGIRAYRAGIDLGWLPDAVVHYRLRPSLSASYRQARAYGRAQSRIRSLVASDASVTAERLRTIKRILWLLRKSPSTTRQSERARWLWVAGQTVGQLEGSVSHKLGRQW